MTRHWSDEDFVTALDGPVAEASARDHLASCAECAARFEDLRAAYAAVRAADGVPEPPPFFWAQAKARVRADVETAPAAGAWFGLRRWQVLVSAMAVLAVVVASLSPFGSPVPDDVQADTRWEDVVEMAGALSPDDAGGFALATNRADLAIESLTPEERAVFVELLRVEMESLE